MRDGSIIKRRYIPVAVFLLLAAASGIAWMLLIRPSDADRPARNAGNGLDAYTYDMVFLPENCSLAVTITLEYTNRTGIPLDHLLLRTWAGAYETEETSPAASDELYDLCYPAGFSPGGIRIEGVWWQESLTEAVFTDTARTALRVSVPVLAPEESGLLRLRCLLTVPQCAHRFGYSEGIWQFGNVLPILSVWRDGAWLEQPYTPVGDPFISICANYSISLTVPAGYLCAASSLPEKQVLPDNRVRYTAHLSAARDFAFALSDIWKTANSNTGGIRLQAYAADEDDAKRMLKTMSRSLGIYERLYGEYPYESYTACAVDFPFGGMEYPGLTFIALDCTDDRLSDTLELVLAHETAHQWFYALTGSDQYSEPWQDEALCEYAMLRYVKETYGLNAWENLIITRVRAPMQEKITERVTPASPLDYFSRADTYSTVVYGRGAACLLALEEMTGRMDDFLLPAVLFQTRNPVRFYRLAGRSDRH